MINTDKNSFFNHLQQRCWAWVSVGVWASLVVSCDSKKQGDGSSTTAELNQSVVARPKSKLPEKVTFNAHIQPILSEKCYHCHGPDSGTRKPEKTPLRIDREQFAFEPRENGKPVIIKGSPDESLLIELMKSSDQDEIMPPPESHKTMSVQEIALIGKWIEQGAEYQEHWAFLAPQRAELPHVKNESWVSNEIDSFTLAKMEKSGLSPNPQLSSHRLLRRIHFDVTGLPPTPKEIKAFAASYQKDQLSAVNSVLDTLFSTPGYGEQQGRLWLDAARYADTHGIHIDNYREIWPYRDWVVTAFNQNMPFDQFTVEQLAGDMLPEPSLDQKVATGFNRCLPTTGEGGSIVEEVNAMYATDRVSTTFGVWQGLTVGCAQCHDHKFDPVSQKEFYQIAAFFRNTTMSALDRNNGRHPPNIFVPIPEDRPSFAKMNAELTQLQEVIQSNQAKYKKARDVEFAAWMNQKKITPAKDELLSPEGQEVFLPLRNPKDKTLMGTAKQEPLSLAANKVSTVPGVFGRALQVGGKPSVEIGDFGDFDGTKGFSFGGFIYVEGKPNGAILARMDPTDNHRGWGLWLRDGQVGAHVIEQFPTASVKAFTKKPLTPKKWHHVMVVFDPSKAKRSLTVYLDGKPAEIKYLRNNLGKNIQTQVPLRLGSSAGNDSALSGVVAVQDLRVVGRVMKHEEVQDLVVDTLVGSAHLAAQGSALEEVLRKQFDVIQPAKLRPEQLRVNELNKESDTLKKRGSYTLIMEEKPKSDPFAHVLERGDYANKGEKVTPGTPAVLPAMGDTLPANRLGLAQWLVDPNNPLTARVTVNRYWHYLFGRGLVETTEDFGIMGSRPSHPELLDWLACEFVSSGWDLQHMLRLMITSSTYRQSAVHTPENMKADPLNILLTRSPRFRLHGEQLRDLALAASGLMVQEVGGAPVKPYQPVGIWSSVAMPSSNTKLYVQDSGSKLYRRSIYTIWKRSAPHPAMELLNAPPRETFCVRRELTNTPLAAFVTMNDVQFVEAARVLATKAMKASSETSTRLDYLTLRLISRALSEDEKSIATATFKQALQKFSDSPDDAAMLIAVGVSPPDDKLPATELAAWTLVASQIFNLDETLTN